MYIIMYRMCRFVRRHNLSTSARKILFFTFGSFGLTSDGGCIGNMLTLSGVKVNVDDSSVPTPLCSSKLVTLVLEYES